MRRTLFLFCYFAFAIPGFAQNSTGWTLVWADEFTQPNGSSPDTNKWAFDTGGDGWGNNELEYYTSRTNNARIENNQLVIEAHQENYLGRTNTSARLKSQGKVSWAYGRIEARIKIPRGQGIWPAFWTLGTNIPSAGWPGCGEIDIMENIGKEPTLVHGTVHGPGYSGGNGIGGPCPLSASGAYADDFHIYAIEWTTNQIKWFRDGQQYFGVNPASLPNATNWVFTKPQFVLLNVAVGGFWPGYPDGTTAFPQRMTVDYVRVYAATNLAACTANLLENSGLESGSLTNWTTYGAHNLLENIKNLPVHDGTNVYKVYGQFSGSENFTGIYQDLAASAGQTFTASGWAFTPSNDQIAGSNTAWMEVSFRNATNVLALYRTALINTNTPEGIWLNLAVTNRLNPTNSAVIGSVTNLVAPTNTSFVRYQVVFRQPANAAGAVLFDDMKLTTDTTAEVPVPVSLTRTGNNLNLGFNTFLDLPYQVHWKADSIDSVWQPLTNITGSGTSQTVVVDTQPASRFFRVIRPCN
jgi:beta-glucanase (GH16 family)